MTETPKFSRRVDIDTAREEAYEIEQSGREASAAVQKGLFMSATKHAKLQDGAYRNGLMMGASKIELRKPINSIEDEEPDKDDWDHGPDFR